MMWSEVKKLTIDYLVRGLCNCPYTNHPKGCPNYDKRNTCPPKCPKVETTIDVNKPIYAIWNKFEFGKHCLKMRESHPEWSPRQTECCLYWQGTARKHLRQTIKKFTLSFPNMCVFQTPEAMGVNVTATMKDLGIDLEWPPKIYTYQIAIAGIVK